MQQSETWIPKRWYMLDLLIRKVYFPAGHTISPMLCVQGSNCMGGGPVEVWLPFNVDGARERIVPGKILSVMAQYIGSTTGFHVLKKGEVTYPTFTVVRLGRVGLSSPA